MGGVELLSLAPEFSRDLTFAVTRVVVQEVDMFPFMAFSVHDVGQCLRLCSLARRCYCGRIYPSVPTETSLLTMSLTSKTDEFE